MMGGVMASQQAASGAIYSPPALPFARFPAAASVPGQYRIASDLNNATLRSDGTCWSPANGHAVIANAHNVNLTIQSLTPAVITAQSFPANFVRAGSRIRTWARWNYPGIGNSVGSTLHIRQGAVGSGLSGGIAIGISPSGSGFPNFEVEHLLLTTALSSNGVTRQTTNNTIGLHTASATTGLNPSVNFTNPWDITFIANGYAETAQTILSASWAANVVTLGYTAAHNYAVGDNIVVSGMTPAGYNGTYIILSTPLTTSWTAALLSNPGAATVMGSSSRTSNVTLVDYYVEWLQ